MIRFVARRIAGELHVSASSREVIRACRAAIAKHHRRGQGKRKERKYFYREALKAHEENKELYASVMGPSEFQNRPKI